MTENKSIVEGAKELLPSLHDKVEYHFWGKVKTGEITEIIGKRIKVSGWVSNGQFSMRWHDWINEGHITKIKTYE